MGSTRSTSVGNRCRRETLGITGLLQPAVTHSPFWGGQRIDRANPMVAVSGQHTAMRIPVRALNDEYVIRVSSAER